jgi:hypothetical protein
MKFQVGDKVLVLVTNEEADVIDIINDKMVMVEVRGVRFPAYTDQLDFPYFKRFTEKKLVPEKKPKLHIDNLPKEKIVSTGKKVATGVWLTFVAVFDTDEFGDEIVTNLKLHLNNQTEAGYAFTYILNYFGEKEFELKNEALAFQDFYLHDIAFADLSDSPSFSFEFSLLTPDKAKAPYFEASLKLKPKQLFNKIEEIKQKGESTFSYKLFDIYPNKIAEDFFDTSKLAAAGFKVYDAKKAKQHLAPARSVVDLHIEKLSDDWKHMSNHEILTLQLKEFEKYYELAVAHYQPQFTVIHGVGTGRLRDEIHEMLRHRNEVKYFVNQYHALYGYGATEINFQY